MIKEKYLYFMDEADGLFNTAFDMLTVPLSRLKGFRANGTTTQLELELKPLVGYADSDDDTFVADHVTLTITANKQKEVIEAITGAIASANAINVPMITVADSENSKFIHGDITAGQSFNVMQAIVDAINGTGVGYTDGYIVVEDDAASFQLVALISVFDASKIIVTVALSACVVAS